MKKTEIDKTAWEDDLYQAILKLKTPDECRRFFADLCTPAEIEAFADRWKVAQMLVDEVTYRKITEETGVSVTTVGRVSRFLLNGNQGYQIILKRLGKL